MTKLVHGGDIYTAMEKGTAKEEILDYSANINPLGMPEGVKRAIGKVLDDCDHYPDPLCRRLARAVAEKEGVPEERLIFGNGAADLIFRLTAAIKPENALIPAPTFAEYEQALRSAGCGVGIHALCEENGFALGEGFLSELTDDLDLIFLCNPNNPTGRLIERDFLRKVLDLCEKKNIFAVVDECFLDFVTDPQAVTVKDWTAEYTRLFILRAFTKNYAMPGLRLGYGICGNRKLLDRLTAAGQPWSVSLLAQEAGVAALKEDAYLEEARQLIFRERKRLVQGLSELGYQVFPPAANYIFFRLPDKNDPTYAARFTEDLAEEGILIRSCANYRGLKTGYFRIAVRGKEENERLLRELNRRERLWQKQL